MRTPVARRVILTGPPGPRGTRPTVAGLAIPAHGSITLSPLSDDAVLVDPARYEGGGHDRPAHARLPARRRVQVDATVTAPGSP